MRRRLAIRCISYLAAAALCLGVFSAVQSRRAAAAGRSARYAGEDAFAALVNQYERFVYNAACRILSSSAQPTDMAERACTGRSRTSRTLSA